MKLRYIVLPILLSLLASLPSFAQKDTTKKVEYVEENDEVDKVADKKNYFKVGINFISDNVYLGRKDSSAVPYITPYIGYYSKYGFYLRALMSYTPMTANPGIDLMTFEAGYDKVILKNMAIGGVVDKYFYNHNSYSVKSEIGTAGTVYALYANDYVVPKVAGEINVGTSTDYVLSGAIDHSFGFWNSRFKIDPAATWFLGTQNYIIEHRTRVTKKNKKGGTTTEVVSATNKFESMSYEFSAPVTYKYHNWLFALNPTYIIPVNPSVIKINKKIYNEVISNTFVIELDASIKFGNP